MHVEDDAFPAVDVPRAVVLPRAQVHVTSHAVGIDVFVDDELRITWDRGPLGAQVVVQVSGSGRDDRLTWWCAVPDDGVFQVPGDVLASLPAGGQGSFVVQRVVETTTVVSPDLRVVGYAQSQDGRTMRLR